MSRIILEPLHQIQRWNGHYLEHSDLRQLGLRIQLGHDSLEECAVPGTTSFLNVIIHRGVQVLCIVYCACNQAPSRQTQLINAGLILTGFVDATIQMILIPDANAQAAEDAKNWQPSDSWLAMAVDIELWTNVWHLGASHDVTTTTTPATEDVHKGASHNVRDSDTIFEEAAQTSGEPQERRWSASPPMITTPVARAVVEVIAAVAETTDDPMLVTELDMLWDHVLKVCMDGMHESQRCTWLVQLDEQERLMNGPPSAYLSGRHKRLIPDGESARKKKRERLAEVAAGAGVGSDDEGWVNYSATQQRVTLRSKLGRARVANATVRGTRQGGFKAWQVVVSVVILRVNHHIVVEHATTLTKIPVDTVGKASMHMADMTGKGNRIHDEPIIENEVEAGRDEQRELTCEHGGAEKTSENGQMMGEL
ncbi:hypothetical protein FB451DRAFT_1200252 [Mycena latifolia]|nr:hypothetical protein FB451DRAFT_1200252 [Mycena latifolia]